MQKEIAAKTQLLLEEIKTSKGLSSEEKGDLQDILLHAEAGTNGCSQEEKVQSISETVFSLVGMLITQRLDGSQSGKLQGLYKVIEACKWQITIISGTIATLLLFRPDLSALLMKLIQAM